MGNHDTLARIGRIALNVTTMPWPCLESAIEQILNEQVPMEQENKVKEWLRLKNHELMNVTVAGTLVASAVTGSIQWSSLETAHWFVSACWYATLLFSLLSVMVAFYLSILLSNFVINSKGTSLLLKSLKSNHNPKRARWGSVFALQVPMMLMSYSLISYVTGLGLMVIRPLWTQPWGSQGAIGVCFVACFAFGIALFGFVCHFTYVQNEEVLKVH